MLACLASENWIGLPEGLPEGGRYFEVSLEDGRIVLTPLRLADADGGREWTAELLRMAQEWLERADREFEAERDLVASRYLWEAVRAAITAVGVKRGIPVDNDDEMFDFVRQIDREDGGNHNHMLRFGVAQSLRDRINRVGGSWCGCDADSWDDSDFEMGRRAAKGMVDYLTGLVAAGA